MAVGTYKNGVSIIYTYQAVGCATGKTIDSVVYDEAHADSGLGGTLAEIGATGRYWKAFTPDAEGEWIVVITNTTDGGGDVVKAYAVAGHDIDSIGDAVAAITAAGPTKVEMDTGHALLATEAKQDANDAIVVDIHDTDLPAVKTVVDAVQAKTDLIGASVAPASEYDTEMARITANVATEAKQDVIDGYHDVPAEDGAPDATIRDVVGKKTDTVAGTSIVALAKQLLADTGTTGSIRGADDDTLKTLSDQIDAVSAPAMVG